MQGRVIGIVVAGLVVAVACATLTPRQEPVSQVVWLEQGWNPELRTEFHHKTQGTMTIPIRYEWFAALEQPRNPLFGLKLFAPLSTPRLFTEATYLTRFGFIASPVSAHNQAGLPIGFAVDYGTTNPAIAPGTFNALGLTCAACHTGHLRHNGVEIRYDGGPAMTDLTLFTKSLAASLLETYLDRDTFERFSDRVLGVESTEAKREELRKQLGASLKALVTQVLKPYEIAATGLRSVLRDADGDRLEKTFRKAQGMIHENEATDEGFTRLDALTRIGNTVFASNTQNYANLATIKAPVSYPPIWNASWFLWVQYDASIMQPMVRNSGEALGVSAYAVLNGASPQSFQSSVRLANLDWIENELAGTKPGEAPPQPTEARAFPGLQAPRWPSQLGQIDVARHAKGQALYAEMCQGCHLAPVDSPEFWSDAHWTPADERGRRYLDLPIVDVAYIGTDPEQSKVLSERKVDTKGIGIATQIWIEDYEWFRESPVYKGGQGTAACKVKDVTDAAAESFAVSLGAVVQQVNDAYYRQHAITPEEQQRMNGDRTNCLRAPGAYKARPLDGIWATAPFLHNGSVPTLYDLLSPAQERPKTFYLGSLDFDPVKVGYRSDKQPALFKLDTSIQGNSNAGHEFADEKRKGVIGRGLSEAERYALIEFLKDPTSTRLLDADRRAPDAAREAAPANASDED